MADNGPCDLCDKPAVHCLTGSAGDFWLCDDHKTPTWHGCTCGHARGLHDSHLTRACYACACTAYVDEPAPAPVSRLTGEGQ